MPYFMVTCSFCGVALSTRMPLRTLCCIVMVISDVMAMHFVFMVRYFVWICYCCKMYLNQWINILQIKDHGSWLDIGTHKSLHEASKYIEVLENRQGLKIACLEEIAFNKKFISKKQLLSLAEPLKNNDYGQYLIQIAEI